MTKREGLWGRTLIYGPPGAGKSWFGVTAFWNPVTRQEVARGKWVTFGQEDNPFLLVPESCRSTRSGVSLRFVSPTLSDQAWLTRFDTFTKSLLDQARKAPPLDVLVIDGLSEFDMLYETTFKGVEGDSGKFAKWNGLMDTFFGIMQRLDPVELGANIIVTARVRERKRGTDVEEHARKKDIEDDAAPFDYYPSIRGGFKDWLGHYFNSVFYVHTRKPKVPGGPSEHVLQVLTGGDYLTKLQGEHLWVPAGYPAELVNPTFYDVQHRLEDLLGMPHILPLKEVVTVPAREREIENEKEE